MQSNNVFHSCEEEKISSLFLNVGGQGNCLHYWITVVNVNAENETNATFLPSVIGSSRGSENATEASLSTQYELPLVQSKPSPNNTSHPDRATMLSWRALKDQGKDEYERGNFEEALSLYQRASTSAATAGGSIFDRQVILSNVVACRLKLGQNERAIQDAQECIQLNPSWSKAYVRLASAYVAVGRSNDACNALQTALRHDPSNVTARQMLLQQLRGRDQQQQQRNSASMNHHSSGGLDADETTSSARNGAARGDDASTRANYNSRPDDIPSSQSRPQHQPSPSTGSNSSHTRMDNTSTNIAHDDDTVDDTMSLVERFRAYVHRWKYWYASLSESRQSALKLLLGLLALYISFGGRFGLESLGGGGGDAYISSNSYRASNHEYGDYVGGGSDRVHWNRRNTAASGYSYVDEDAYDRRQRRQQQRPPRHQVYQDDKPPRRPSSSSSSSSSSYHRDRGYYDDAYTASNHRGASYDRPYRSSSSYWSGGGGMYDGDYSIPWRLILLVVVLTYLARRHGINLLPLLLFRAGFGGFGGGGGIFYGGGGFGGRHYRRGRIW
jgi:tetratricopeptide (TPR) repeat protein